MPVQPVAAQALIAWTAANHLGRPVCIVTENSMTMETLHRDLRTLDGACTPGKGFTPSPSHAPLLFFPAFERLPSETTPPDAEILGARWSTLETLLTCGAPMQPSITVTDIQALMQPVPPADRVQAALIVLKVSDTLEPDALALRLEDMGYEFSPEVQAKGQLSMRGGILDCWPTDHVWPIRLEFFGPEINSIRTFDPETQRSVSRPTLVRITPVTMSGLHTGSGASLAPYLSADTLLIWTDRDMIHEHGEAQVRLYAQSEQANTLLAFDDVVSELGLRAAITLTLHMQAGSSPLCDLVFERHAELNAGILSDDPDQLKAQRTERLNALIHAAKDGRETAIFFDTPGSATHFTSEVPALKKLPVVVAPLSSGFTCEPLNVAVLAEADLYAHRRISAQRYDPLGDQPRPERQTGDRLDQLASLEPHDLVVHVDHGLGRYRGLLEIEVQGQRQEVISIEYDQGARLHIPTRHAHLLSKYVGVSSRRVRLHRLGSGRWDKEKGEAQQAIADMAASLLETQAQRAVLQGTAYPPDTAWQREFEAAFPYQETPDQLRVIDEIKMDMESSKPMDRLLCGDAGYGKTEVAMRAAFKAVMSTKQVAMLVPTTVLAQQHFFTFMQRMRAYPIRIEMLSRFVTTSQRQRILSELAEGSIDIIISTHGLLRGQVRFANLGLAIIDEEQRFGVADKEKIKKMRRMVDVLTMTATPIPRTLYMSMTGAKDLSLLQTPPRERMAIETRVEPNDDAVIRQAVMREVGRGGQVYYLHNRVMTIDRVARRLRELLPDIRIAVAHGQMPTPQLRLIMRAFVDGNYDMLLCTVIIESGVDIPRANTILIDRADRFGIADLYQLRGRVGRSSHKAYAYLLLPPHGHLDRDARRRIKALQRHSKLGGGFQLALQDLEIRGAGNILGAAQSGHITAVGFGLYCQLLRRTVAQLKGEDVPPVIDVDIQFDFLDLSPANADRDNAASIPYRYIDDEHLRIEFYRRFAELTNEAEVAQLEVELVDRFGPKPIALEHLLTIARIRIAAHAQGIGAIRISDTKVRLIRHGKPLQKQSRFPRLQSVTPGEQLAEISDLVQTAHAWSD